MQTESPLHSLLIIHGLLDGFAMDDPIATTHLSRGDHVDLVHRLSINRLVTDGLFIPPSTVIRRSPAYLFTTDSASVPSGSGASWKDYIPWRHSHGFTLYALPFGPLLDEPFTFGLPLQTASPLRSPLMIHGLLDGFAVDDLSTATHLSRCRYLISQLLECLEYECKLLLLSEADRKHRLEP